MSATTHHEIHPDAEVLSAFAEQALGAKERGKLLGHLAQCGRCREIVALAREAAGAKIAPARIVTAAVIYIRDQFPASKVEIK